MIIEQSEHIICEVGKAFMGKDDIVRKVLMTIYAGAVPRYRPLSSCSLHRYLFQHVSPHHRQGIWEEIQC